MRDILVHILCNRMGRVTGVKFGVWVASQTRLFDAAARSLAADCEPPISFSLFWRFGVLAFWRFKTQGVS